MGWVELDHIYYRIKSIQTVTCGAKSSDDPKELAFLIVDFYDMDKIVVKFESSREAIHKLWDITNPGWRRPE